VLSEPTVYRERVSAIRRRLGIARADALLVTHLPNIYYLCGFSGSAGVLLVHPSGITLFTDGRYRIQAREEVLGAKVRIERRSPFLAIGERLRRGGRARVAFAPGQLTVAQKKELGRAAGARVRWIEMEGVVEELRAVKDDDEIGRMRDAARLASDVFEAVTRLVKPGVLECELSAEVEYRMRQGGASGVAFDTIIASGARSASPHARPTPKPLRKNELVVLDLGAILRRYCSDLTRTVYLGRAPARIRQWYRAVVEAQGAAREALRPDTKAGTVDEAARRILKRHGLERYFVHSTGHGLGLEVHEAPRIGRGGKARLRPGNVVTLEPGVYVECVGGIRVEDDVLLLPRGTEVLTRATRDFLEL
jgi:Xaa-Pro aminopeptidase